MQPEKDPVIPDDLESPSFREAWSDWLAFRKEIKKPAGPTAQKRLLIQCQKMGLDKAIASIDQSIRNNWQGLFEPRDYKPPKKINPDVEEVIRAMQEEAQGDLF